MNAIFACVLICGVIIYSTLIRRGEYHCDEITLHVRLNVWLSKMCLIAAVGLSLVKIITMHTHANLPTIIECGVIAIAIMIMCTACSLQMFRSQTIVKCWTLCCTILTIRACAGLLILPSTWDVVNLLLYSAATVFGVLELFSPVRKSQLFPPPAEYTCDLFDYLSFTYLNQSLIHPALKKIQLEMDDVPTLVDEDSAHQVWKSLKPIFYKDKANIVISLFQLVKREWQLQGLFQFVASCTLLLAPLALEQIIRHVSHGNNSAVETTTDVNIYVAVLLLFLGPLMKCVCDCQHYMRGQHVGIRIRAALISAVYDKALSVDLTSCKQGVGKINNLISVDIASIQEFCTYSHLLWATFFEISLCCGCLVYVLGPAAWVGVGVMVLALWLGSGIGKVMEKEQDELLVRKDARMSVVNEILNGIRIIKLFAWEDKMRSRLSTLRRSELGSLWRFAMVQALNFTLWDTVPAIVALSAFLLHICILQSPLTPAQGFTALTLFNLLRWPLAEMADIINVYFQAKTSMRRIQEFLISRDVQGLTPQLPACELHGIEVENAMFGWNNISVVSGLDDDDVDNESNDNSNCCDCDIFSHCNKWTQYTSDYERVSSDGATTHGCDSATQTASSVDSFSILDNDDEPADEVESGRRTKQSIIMTHITTDISPKIGLSSDQSKAILSHVTMRLPPKSLTVIVGLTGSGKSTLLAGLLGECQLMNAGSGHVRLPGSVSYVSQSAWIQNASLRDNITFGSPFNADRYEQVLAACALHQDLKLLPVGDMTEIGEKGVNLSGGQQQRVSLARAAYAHSDVILLDDPLSAVDAHVGDHIFHSLICKFLAGRTVVLVTHQVALAVPAAAVVVCLDGEGGIAACCPPGQLTAAYEKLVETRQTRHADIKADEDAAQGGDIMEFIKSLAALVQAKEQNDITKQNELTAQLMGVMTGSKARVRVDSASSHFDVTSRNRTLTSSSNQSHGDSTPRSGCDPGEHDLHLNEPFVDTACENSLLVTCSNQSHDGKIVAEETKQAGEVGLKVYYFYLQACGGSLVAISLLFCCIWIAVSNLLVNYSLGVWLAEMQGRRIGQPSHDQSFWMYVGCGCSVVVATSSRWVYQARVSLRAAQTIHDNLGTAVILAPVSWYDATPVGRIVNRLSQDMYTVDTKTMMHLMELTDCLLGSTQIVAVVAVSIPWLFFPMLPVMAFTAWVSYQYLHVSRELKRLESINKSPVFVQFSETLLGLSIIRSFQQQSRFFNQCCDKIDVMNRCHLYMWLCNRWLHCRMQLMGACVTGSVALAVVLTADNIGSTAAGLALLYSLTFTDYLTFLSRKYAEINMNSVERIQEYTTVEPEKYYPDGSHTTGRQTDERYRHMIPDRLNVPRACDAPWPSQGCLEFVNISMKYKTSSSLVLRNVNFRIPGGKKVGIVGRTGAGKSSIVATLFRMVEPEGGSIIIDGVNVLEIPLHTLRSRLAIVPQDPILFQGTVRSNLDPFSHFTDAELWRALRSVHMADYVAGMGGAGLDDKQVADKGSNLSVGQRQLLCMARALLRKSSVLVLDECTASVDHETDGLIQDTVRQELADCTVLCIAHRLHTIAYYDLVLVMDQGTVAEMGSPLELMQIENSIFRGMCTSSGDFNSLLASARGTAT